MRFTKGINQDVDPSAQPEGTYRDLINGVLNDKTGSIVKDRPTQEITDLQAGEVEVKGSVTISEQDRVILFIYSNSSNNSRILNVNLNSNSVSSILTDDPQDQRLQGSLDFDQADYIDTSYSINNNGELIIYWTDGVNPPRFYNVTKGDDIVDYKLNIFPYYNSSNNTTSIDFTIPNIKDSGGSLSGGSYQLAFAYIDNDGLLTNYFYVSEPIRIKKGDYFSGINAFYYEGLSDDEQTSKAISFRLAGLDTNYERVRVSAIKGTNVGNVADLNIPPNGAIDYTYTGSEDEVVGSIDEIAIDQPSYNTANTITQYNSQLYMGGLEENGLTKSEKEDLQAAALDVEVSADFEYTRPQNGGQSEPLPTKPEPDLQPPGFKRGEVYALYISFMRRDGRETEAFHVPGRPPTIGNEKDAYSNDGVSFTDRYKALAEPDGTYNMGYWENKSENYPQREPFTSKTTTDINGNTVNYSQVNVRHHRVPGPTYLNRPTKIEGFNREANVFGFSVTNVSVPSNLSDKIVGYKLYYAKKEDSDKLIIDQGAFNPGWLDVDSDTQWVNENYSNALIDGVNFNEGSGGCDDVEIDILDDGTKTTQATLCDADDEFQTAEEIRDAINSAGFSNFLAELTDDGKGVKINYTNINDPNKHNGSAIPSLTALDNDGNGDTVSATTIVAFDEAVYPRGYRPFQNGDEIFQNRKYCTYGFDSLHKHDADGNGVFEGENWGSDRRVAYGRPAYSMINRPNISGVTHLKAVEAIEYVHEPIFSEYDLENANDNRTKVLGPHESGGEDEDWFIGVNAGPVYIEKNQRRTDISSSFDFGYDMDNLLGESKVVIELNSSSLRRGFRTIFDMCVTQDNVHSPYDRQQLVDTSKIGYVDSNGDGQDLVFRNGDTFICENEYKANTLLSLLDGTEDNNDDSAWPNPFDEYWISNISDVLEVDGKSGSGELKGTRLGIQEEIGNISGFKDTTPFPVGHKYDSFVESRIPCGLIADGDGKYEDQEPVPDVYDLEPSANQYDTSNSPPAKQIIIARKWSRHFIESDNYPVWNAEYAKLNTIRSAFPWDPYDVESSEHYNRVIRSSGDEDTGRSKSFRRFLEEDYIDIKEDRGEILNLTEFKDNLIIHLERSLIQTRGQERMQTSEGQNVFIGNGNIFNVDPSEIKTTELGYAGLESFRAKTNCELGYFFVDKSANSIYWLSESKGFNELTTERFGLSEFFDEKLRNKDINSIVGYDADSGRVMFTLRDTNNPINTSTISFYPSRPAWGSRHSYHPDYYVDALDTLSTIKDDTLYVHKEGSNSGIYGIDRVFQFKYAVPHGFNNKVDHVWVNADHVDKNGVITEDLPIDTMEVENSTQTTGNMILNDYNSGTPTDITDRGNIRKTQGVWRVHDIRETGGGPSYLPNWAQDPRLEDDYHIVTIEKTASDSSIILRAAGLQSEQTIH